MKRLSIFICALTLALVAANAAPAQTLLPGASQFNPPPPAPPPPPRIEVPAIPQLDAPPRQTLQSVPQSLSFCTGPETCARPANRTTSVPTTFAIAGPALFATLLIVRLCTNYH